MPSLVRTGPDQGCGGHGRGPGGAVRWQLRCVALRLRWPQLRCVYGAQVYADMAMAWGANRQRQRGQHLGIDHTCALAQAVCDVSVHRIEHPGGAQ